MNNKNADLFLKSKKNCEPINTILTWILFLLLINELIYSFDKIYNPKAQRITWWRTIASLTIAIFSSFRIHYKPSDLPQNAKNQKNSIAKMNADPEELAIMENTAEFNKFQATRKKQKALESKNIAVSCETKTSHEKILSNLNTQPNLQEEKEIQDNIYI
jgi:hypothetical protein